MNDYKHELITDILNILIPVIDDVEQIENIKSKLSLRLYNFDIIKKERALTTILNEDVNDTILKKFLAAKTVEGRTHKTLKFYMYTIREMFRALENKPYNEITSEDIYVVLAKAKMERQCGNVYLNSIRRNMSSFYAWLYKNEYIKKNPMFKVTVVKEVKTRKKALTQIEIEKIRDVANVRERALFEVLLGTAMRLGELVKINRQDINYMNREVTVMGKGQKERVCFLTQTSIHYLNEYLATRKDDNEALFVGIQSPNNRLCNAGVEIIMKKLGDQVGVKLHPHKLRRTAATMAMERGMSLTSVQRMLGHANPATTMIYLDLNNTELRHEHNKYLG